MTKEAIVNLLYDMYQKRGFVTTDEIFDACDEANLSVFDTDYVSNKVLEKGALVTDEQPLIVSERNLTYDEEELTDYTQTDYNKIFTYFNDNYPGMSMILDYIKSAKPLQHGEMAQLITQIRSGNTYAKEIAFNKNMRLALKTTYNYRDKTTISLEEVFQEACLSILKAIDSYDPYVHSAFTSYCSTWIMQRINRFIMDYENTIRVPVHVQERLNQIEKIVNSLPLLNKSEIAKIVADKLEVSVFEAEELLIYFDLRNTLSLDDIYPDYNEIPLCVEESICEIADENEFRIIIQDILSTIPERESSIIKMRFGINLPREYTLSEIGESFNLTRSRIQQLEEKALRRLRHPSRTQRIKDFL